MVVPGSPGAGSPSKRRLDTLFLRVSRLSCVQTLRLEDSVVILPRRKRQMNRREPLKMSHGSDKADAIEVDVLEHGLPRNGEDQTLDRRLFFQLLVFDIEASAGPRTMVSSLARKLREQRIPSVIYEDVNDHRGLGLLVWNEDPARITETIRPILGGKRFNALTPRPGWVMFGRTYSSGYEEDLEFWLLDRPQQTVLNKAWEWGIWYPNRRNGDFALLDAKTRGEVLREHAMIGRAYGAADLVHDVRLAAYGLDPEDNDFILGLIGKDLHALSHVVQRMRSTAQTASHIEKMGPFFVGRKAWQFPENTQPEAAPESTEEASTDEAAAPDAAAAGEATEDLATTESAMEAPPESAPEEAGQPAEPGTEDGGESDATDS